MPEPKLQLLRRQVDELTKHVNAQHKIVGSLRDAGQPTEQAAELLKGMENVLSVYQAKLRRAEAELGPGDEG